MVQFECPRHWKPTASSFSGVVRIPFSQLLALWGNKNWLPSMKVKKLENHQNKRGSTDCQWSSLNGPCTENSQSYFSAILSDSDINMYYFVVPVRARKRSRGGECMFLLISLVSETGLRYKQLCSSPKPCRIEKWFLSCQMSCVCEVDNISVWIGVVFLEWVVVTVEVGTFTSTLVVVQAANPRFGMAGKGVK